MIQLLAEASPLGTEILISLLGSGGIVGAIVGFTRLRGEKGTVAVGQAQGANEVLQETLLAVERERDYWKHRFEACAAQLARIVAELDLEDRLND